MDEKLLDNELPLADEADKNCDPAKMLEIYKAIHELDTQLAELELALKIPSRS